MGRGCSDSRTSRIETALAQEYCRMLFALCCLYNLERLQVLSWAVCEATNLYRSSILRLSSAWQRNFMATARCGRGYGESWYSTDKVYDVGGFNPEAWPYLEKEILNASCCGEENPYQFERQAMLDYLSGTRFSEFLPRSNRILQAPFLSFLWPYIRRGLCTRREQRSIPSGST